ncbi:MAG: S8 family serine peptidase [Phycisphaerales bacterium]
MTSLDINRSALSLLISVLLALPMTAFAGGQVPTMQPPLPPQDAERVTLGETVIATWTAESTTFEAISLDEGKTFSGGMESSSLIRLRYATFDPALEVAGPSVPEHMQWQPDRFERDVYIVQFISRALEQYRDDVRAAGGVIHKFLPDNAYLVSMDAVARDAVMQLPCVRWVGAYHPAYRTERVLFNVLREDPALLPPMRLIVQVFERGLAQKQIVADRIVAMGGSINAMIPDGFLLEATLDGTQLLAVLTMPQVLFVDRWSAPEEDMNNAREMGGANFVENQTGFTGQGVRAEVMDGNVLESHQDFQAHPVIFHGPRSGSSGHGTPTYGINFGNGTGNSNGRGMAPEAQGIFASYEFLNNRYQHTAELVNSPYFAVYQSNSWGNARTRDYTTRSFEMDDIILLNDFLICQSQSNAGNQDSRPEAWAKNIVSVGGVRHNNTLVRSDDRWGGGASIGPAADGRIKPDLTHYYDSIYTTSSSGGYTDGFGGTSGATPITAGHFAILFQMYSEAIFGNETPGDSVFENRPHAATAKAIMINTALPYDWTQGGSNGDITRVRQGWGTADLKRIYEQRERTFIVNEEVALRELQSATYELTVPANTPQLRATLVYADPAGTTSAQRHRINDLSLRVTAPGGQQYWGNSGLTNGIWSAPGGSANVIDTVENVFIENPTPGIWTVEVLASEVNEDAHLETQVIDADFALVVSGVTVPTDEVALLTDVNVTYGTLVSGGIATMRESDDTYLIADSAYGFLSSQPNVLRVVAGFEASGTPSTFDVTVESRTNNPVGLLKIAVKHWQRNEFDTVGTGPVGNSDSTVMVENLDAAGRIRASDGRMEVETTHIVIATFSSTGFRGRIDMVQVSLD